MQRSVAPSRPLRAALLTVALVFLAWLCIVAAHPTAADQLPKWLRWFGRPGSVTTLAIVGGVLVALCVLSFRSQRARRSRNVPVVVVAGLAATSAVLGFSSFWRCHDATHPAFFQPLIWTVSLVKGGVNDFVVGGSVCPSPPPEGLWIARLSALGAIFFGLAGVVIALFRSQVDRVRASLASSVTAVVGIDEQTRSMVSAIATTLNRASTLVVVTSGTDEPGVQEARLHGGRVVTVDFNVPGALESLSLWRNLERLYLMSADPPTNQSWLEAITRALSEVDRRKRLPLTVRIDDPWQAEAWRAQQLSGSDTCWAADAVGKYEVTAAWLLENIVTQAATKHVFVCGTSELTLALCAELTRRKLEYDYYSAPDETPLPALTLVAADAQEYLQDHEFHRQQVGFVSTGPTIKAVPNTPTVSLLMDLIGESNAPSDAVIFVDDMAHGPSTARSTGTRLAARFPTMPIYIWDNDAQRADEPLPIVGRLRTYRLALDVPEGQAADVWERAAKLIHERFVATIEPQPNPPPARLPWTELDEFYRESNRRQVRNALWMVEQIAEHTWNTWGNPPKPLSVRDMAGLTALQQLARMGFDHDPAMKMAKAEHEDWCRYYRRNHWKYGPVRDDEHRVHDKLVDWSVVEADDGLRESALRSLATTLWSLRQLGYRSRPIWQPFARIGTVTAEQVSAPWTWTSQSGHTMQADAGDWRVQSDGDTWSVRDHIFRTSYEHVAGDQWRRCGEVFARPAQPGETIETLEGPTTAADGDWVVRGADGEEWPVPAREFTARYAERD
jgi:RyR domain-containing protein